MHNIQSLQAGINKSFKKAMKDFTGWDVHIPTYEIMDFGVIMPIRDYASKLIATINSSSNARHLVRCRILVLKFKLLYGKDRAYCIYEAHIANAMQMQRILIMHLWATTKTDA